MTSNTFLFKVFVLRKKQNQIILLHVFPNTIMTFFLWCYLKFLPNEQDVIIGFFFMLLDTVIIVAQYLALSIKYNNKYISM